VYQSSIASAAYQSTYSNKLRHCFHLHLLGDLAALLPQGLHIVGSYTSSSSSNASWQPLAGKLPAVTASNTANNATWSITGQQVTAAEAAAPAAAAGTDDAGLDIVAGFVPLR
jgi:hypothetical protein